MRALLLIPCVLLAALVFAPEAQAEEVFVLDNGFVIRGRVVREDKTEIIIKLAGFAKSNTITIAPSEVVRRFLRTAAPTKGAEPIAPLPSDYAVPDGTEPPKGAWAGTPKTVLLAPDLLEIPITPGGVGRDGRGIDAIPSMKEEGFFERLGRVSALSLPQSLEGLLLVGFLLLVVLTVMVAGGTRLLGMKALSLHASTTLGLMLGVFLVADIRFSDTMLRADRAVWVLPLQVILWLFVARATLDAPIARIIPLFALVLFAATGFVFATGSLLVSI